MSRLFCGSYTVAGKFEDAVRKWAQHTGKSLENVATASFLDVTGGVIRDTPVDKGQLRANWRVGIDAPATGQLDIVDPSGQATQAALINQAPNIFGRLVYFTNNLPYARRIEYEGYSSVKAPQGMLRININRFTDAVELAIRESQR